ncbi:hypothetical protein MAR_037394 [Mya arenaria]|uniref:Uncharacterized protein n=1 Tax=Mya arenaria TaxID=6604 RepID=A0ABY7FNC0_MYAAR|nr:hypothetical protein MAR_037394 [Mya arenaria]
MKYLQMHFDWTKCLTSTYLSTESTFAKKSASFLCHQLKPTANGSSKHRVAMIRVPPESHSNRLSNSSTNGSSKHKVATIRVPPDFPSNRLSNSSTISSGDMFNSIGLVSRFMSVRCCWEPDMEENTQRTWGDNFRDWGCSPQKSNKIRCLQKSSIYNIQGVVQTMTARAAQTMIANTPPGSCSVHDCKNTTKELLRLQEYH